jgi:hypothetical protein
MPSLLKLKANIEDNQVSDEVVRYNFNPGLQVNDEMTVELHYGGWEDKPFSFKAMVVRIEKFIQQHKGGDIFRIEIYVDLADKEELPRMREILRKFNSGSFEED